MKILKCSLLLIMMLWITVACSRKESKDSLDKDRTSDERIRMYLQRADNYIQLKRLVEALEESTKAEKIAPHDIEVIQRMCIIHYALGDYKKSLEYSEKILAMVPHSAIGLFYQGRAFQQMGDWPKAIDSWEKLASVKPGNSVYFYLGQAYQVVGGKEKALKAYNTAIQHKQDDHYAHWEAGKLAQSLQKWEEAKSHFLAVQKFDKNCSAEVHYFLAQIALGQKDYLKAKEETNTFIQKENERRTTGELLLADIDRKEAYSFQAQNRKALEDKEEKEMQEIASLPLEQLEQKVQEMKEKQEHSKIEKLRQIGILDKLDEAMSQKILKNLKKTEIKPPARPQIPPGAKIYKEGELSEEEQ